MGFVLASPIPLRHGGVAGERSGAASALADLAQATKTDGGGGGGGGAYGRPHYRTLPLSRLLWPGAPGGTRHPHLRDSIYAAPSAPAFSPTSELGQGGNQPTSSCRGEDCGLELGQNAPEGSPLGPTGGLSDDPTVSNNTFDPDAAANVDGDPEESRGSGGSGNDGKGPIIRLPTVPGGGSAGPGPIVVPDKPVDPVPEPATWGLMVIGFGGVAYALRRRGRLAAR